MHKLRAALVVVASLIVLAQARAQPNVSAQREAPAANISARACTDIRNKHESSDQRLIEEIMAAFQQEGFPAFARRLDELRTAAAHAPACYPLIEERDAEIIIRSGETEDFLILSTLFAMAKPGKSIVQRANTYADVFLILGSHYNEARNGQEAIAWLDRGLALQPSNQLLISEKVASLQVLHRHDQAVALLQGALDNPELALTLDRSRFLRLLGINLIDLERLDEAEAALNESIRLNADNPIACNELAYIAELRAGARRTAPSDIWAPNAPQQQQQQPQLRNCPAPR
jgi:tetratricopeptide (TPR) repeat protein